MKKFYLSPKKARITSIIVSILMIAFSIVVSVFLEIRLGYKIALFVVSLIIGFLYIFLMFSSKIVINKDSNIMEIIFVNKNQVSLNNINEVKAVLEASNPRENFSIILYDFDDNELSSIPTFYGKNSIEKVNLVVEDIKKNLH